MKANQADYPIDAMCRTLDVSTSGYYAWLKREPSKRDREESELLELILTIFDESHETYGVPRVHAVLRARGVRVGKKRVARLMAQEGLQGVSRRRGGPRTTVRAKGVGPAADLVDRDFSAESPDQLWVADITYIPT